MGEQQIPALLGLVFQQGIPYDKQQTWHLYGKKGSGRVMVEERQAGVGRCDGKAEEGNLESSSLLRADVTTDQTPQSVALECSFILLDSKRHSLSFIKFHSHLSQLSYLDSEFLRFLPEYLGIFLRMPPKVVIVFYIILSSRLAWQVVCSSSFPELSSF